MPYLRMEDNSFPFMLIKRRLHSLVPQSKGWRTQREKYSSKPIKEQFLLLSLHQVPSGVRLIKDLHCNQSARVNTEEYFYLGKVPRTALTNESNGALSDITEAKLFRVMCNKER